MGIFSARDFFLFQLRRGVVALYKRYLINLEDIQEDHKAMLGKLKAILPPEYHKVVDAADYFTDDKFAHVRKRVLDEGNETLRQLLEVVDKLDVGFNIRKKENEATVRVHPQSSPKN